MSIQLSEHFTYRKLIRFVLPSVIMMICSSVYSVVDGLFVSNFVGKTPFAAINLIMPVLMILGTLGFMIGTGGSALVSKKLGEGETETANQYFSMLIYALIVGGLLFMVIGQLLLRPIAGLLGAEGETLEYCVLYGRILLLSLMPYMLQNAFQSFFVAAARPQLGLTVTVAAGLTNVILDFLFVAVLQWGLSGAALATVTSQCVGGFFPLIYFFRKNSSLLHLGKARFEAAALLKACVNGSSELMTTVSSSLVNILYNLQLMRLIGEDGVAAYGVIMYVYFIFAAIFIGYAIGSAPVISYHYGAEDWPELKGLFRKSLLLILLSGIVLTVLAEMLSGPLAQIFVGYDAELRALTVHGFRLYAICFLLAGFNTFGSAFFTALNNGVVSAAISFLRTLLFQVGTVLILPVFLGLDGVWLAIVAAELLALFVTIFFFFIKRKQYHYI